MFKTTYTDKKYQVLDMNKWMGRRVWGPRGQDIFPRMGCLKWDSIIYQQEAEERLIKEMNVEEEEEEK